MKKNSTKYIFHEVIEQKYTGNNCKFSGGFVQNHPVDSMYIQLEKDGQKPTIIYLRPDEVACIGWICTGILWSKEMGENKSYLVECRNKECSWSGLASQCDEDRVDNKIERCPVCGWGVEPVADHTD